MGLSAGPVERRVEDYANGKRGSRSRKPPTMIISAAIAVVIGIIATGAAMLNEQPTRQHVEVEITPIRVP